MTIQNISKYESKDEPKNFLGITFPNWIAIIGVILTMFTLAIGASSKVSAIETKQNAACDRQDRYEIQVNQRFENIETKVDRIDRNTSEANGMLKILINK